MRTSLKIAFIVLAAFAVFQIYTGLAATFVKSTHGKNESFQWQRFLYFQQNSSRKTSSPGREEQTRPPSSVFGMHRNGTKLLQDHPKSNTDSVPSIAAFLLRRPDSLAENDVQHTDTSSLPWKSVRPNNASLGLQDGAKLLLSSAAGKVKLPVVRVLSLRAENLPACPETPPGLVGAVQPLTGHQNVTSVQQKCEWLEQGGNYRPYRCKAAHRTAILIPYRNRWTHLHVLLANLLPFLHKQQADFTIFVIEQEPPFTFNRALLLNVGVLEASLRDLYTCFIFHDVDLIPLNDRHLYRCREQPKHFAVAINKFGYRLAYDGCVGGVTGLSRDQVEKINGNSNLYFGWGGEDDELRQRIQARGMTVVRDRPQISRYDMFKHSRDHGNEPNPSRNHPTS